MTKNIALFFLLFLYGCMLAFSDTRTPRVRLTGVWAYGEIVTDSTTLDTEQNNLRFYCAVEDSVSFDEVEFDFMLEGHDKKWFTPFREGWYFYTDLAPGDYVFRARCRYPGGKWGEEIAHPFHITGPWWQTWWAISFYVLVVLGTLGYFFFLYQERQRLHNNLKVEREVMRFRTDFVIQAGREFRTPLTVIRSVVEKLTGTPDTHLTRTDIQHLRNSSNQLMHMVEDLMEFNSIGKETAAGLQNDVLEMADNPINDCCVLVVEPDKQLADVIRRDLQKYLKAQCVENVTETMEMVKRFTPQMVILDTDLEQVNAYNLLHEICSQSQTHVILISSFTDKRSVIRALRSEADDYLPKPFNVEVLSAIVLKRIRLHRETSPSTMASSSEGQDNRQETPQTPVLLEKRSDRLFLNNLELTVASHLADEDFDVNMLAEYMKFSRGQLGKKIKQLCGMTAIEYIRIKRLEKAASLLQDTRMNVQEIMYKTGFTDTNTFFRRFKEKYGTSPIQYKNG